MSPPESSFNTSPRRRAKGKAKGREEANQDYVETTSLSQSANGAPESGLKALDTGAARAMAAHYTEQGQQVQASADGEFASVGQDAGYVITQRQDENGRAVYRIRSVSST